MTSSALSWSTSLPVADEDVGLLARPDPIGELGAVADLELEVDAGVLGVEARRPASRRPAATRVSANTTRVVVSAPSSPPPQAASKQAGHGEEDDDASARHRTVAPGSIVLARGRGPPGPADRPRRSSGAATAERAPYGTASAVALPGSGAPRSEWCAATPVRDGPTRGDAGLRSTGPRAIPSPRGRRDAMTLLTPAPTTTDLDPRGNRTPVDPVEPTTVYVRTKSGMPKLRPYFADTWSRRPFIWHLARTQLKAENYDSVAGQVWIILNPLLMALVYLMVRSIFRRSGSEDRAQHHRPPDHGRLLLQVRQRSARERGQLDQLSNSQMVLNTAFPRIIFPLSAAIAGVHGVPADPRRLLRHPLVPRPALHPRPSCTCRWSSSCSCVFNLGVSLFFAPLNVLYKDVKSMRALHRQGLAVRHPGHVQRGRHRVQENSRSCSSGSGSTRCSPSSPRWRTSSTVSPRRPICGLGAGAWSLRVPRGRLDPLPAKGAVLCTPSLTSPRRPAARRSRS